MAKLQKWRTDLWLSGVREGQRDEAAVNIKGGDPCDGIVLYLGCSGVFTQILSHVKCLIKHTHR